MNKGDKLKWKIPLSRLEEIERFIVLEDRGNRVLVESNLTECFGALVPQYVYEKKI